MNMRNLVRILVVAVTCIPALALGASGSGMAGVGNPAPATTVILIRHAEKEAEPKDDPPINETGKARARLFARMLASVPVDRVFVSPLARSRQTAEPLLAAKSIEAEAINPKDFQAIAARILKNHKGKVVVVVGHSNTVPGIIEALGGPVFPEIDERSFDDMFVVTVPAHGPATAVRLKYGL